MADPRLGEVLHLLSPPVGEKLWYGGATPLGSLRGVDHRQAAWRPASGRKCIWDLVLHMAYWKYAVRRRIEETERGAFPRAPSNWPDLPSPADAKAWKADRVLLRSEHESFMEAVSKFDPGRLDEVASGGEKYRYIDLMLGVVTHDLYHTGQIQMLKRISRSRG